MHTRAVSGGSQAPPPGSAPPHSPPASGLHRAGPSHLSGLLLPDAGAARRREKTGEGELATEGPLVTGGGSLNLPGPGLFQKTGPILSAGTPLPLQMGQAPRGHSTPPAPGSKPGRDSLYPVLLLSGAWGSSGVTPLAWCESRCRHCPGRGTGTERSLSGPRLPSTPRKASRTTFGEDAPRHPPFRQTLSPQAGACWGLTSCRARWQ